MNWQIKKLVEVCEINMGQSPISLTYNQKRIGLPFYQGKKDYGIINPIPRIWCSEPLKVVEKNDILISVRAPVGSLNIAIEKSCIGRGLAGLRAKQAVLSQDFLLFFLKLKEKEISAKGTGSTFKAISKKDIEKIEIPIPSLSEQKEIVKVLDEKMGKIAEAKRLREELLADTEKILSQTLAEIFEECKGKNWEETDIHKVTQRVQNINPEDKYEKDFKYIDISSVHKGKGIQEYKMYSIGDAPSRARRPIKEGDTLFALTRPYLRNIAFVTKDYNNAVASTGFSVLRAKKDIINPTYLSYLVSSDWFVEKVLPFQRGATYPAINETDIFRQKFLLPPLSEQQKIVAKLDALSARIRELKGLQTSQLADLKSLERAYLREAFNGELI